MNWLKRALLLALGGFVAGFIATSLTGASEEPPSSGTIVFRYSHFSQTLVTAQAGVPITLTLRNDDPIDHEWIVGTADVHQRHRTGTEPYHDEVATEVTVPAFSSRTTTLTFALPGDYEYVCHLPGHEEYGMRGVLRVLPNR